MSLELVILLTLLSLFGLFIAQLIYFVLKRPFKMSVAGYKHLDEHDPFHHRYRKKYSGFQLVFLPLVEGESLLKFQSSTPIQFKGTVCRLEIVRIERSLFEKIASMFERIEEHDEFSLTLYLEAIEFNTKEMQSFVEQLDQEITMALNSESHAVV
jgi:hypothetical protein